MNTVMVQPILLETSPTLIGVALNWLGGAGVVIGSAMLTFALLAKMLYRESSGYVVVGGLLLVVSGLGAVWWASRHGSKAGSGHKSGHKSRPDHSTPQSDHGLASGLDWGHILAVGLAIVTAILAAVVLGLVARGLWRHHVARRTQAEIVSGRLATMRHTMNGIAGRLGAIQSDPVESLHLYALFDTGVAESERFWRCWISVGDRLADAERTRTIPDGLHADIDQCQKSWTAAMANAQRVGLDALGHGRKPQGEKAVRAITLARSTRNEHEQARAWQTAANILATLHLAHLPNIAKAAVDKGAQTAITTG